VSFSDKLGFKVPSIDFPMYMLLQKKLGSTAFKTNIIEAKKVLHKSQQSLLPMFPVPAYLEHQNLPGAQGKAVKDLANLAGRAFYDMSDMRRRNFLEIVGQNIVSLVNDRDKFKIEEVVKKLRIDGQFLSDINSLDLGKSRSRSVKDRLAPPLSSPGDSRRRQNSNYSNNATNKMATIVMTRAAPVEHNSKTLLSSPTKPDHSTFAATTVARRLIQTTPAHPTEAGSCKSFIIPFRPVSL
jgi:hypothetical protein